MSATSLAFGTYQPLSGLPVASTASVTVRCSPGATASTVSYTVGLGAGSSSQFAARALAGPGTSLHHQVYADPLLSQVWGDGSPGTQAVSASYLLTPPLPASLTYVAYGQIPGRRGLDPAASATR